MAQSTSVLNGCDAAIFLDDAAGTPVDISGSSNSVRITITNTTGAWRRCGQDFPRRRILRKDAQCSLTAVYSTEATEAAQLLINWAGASAITSDDARTITIDLPDSTSGSRRFTVEVLPGQLDMNIAAGSAGPLMVSMNFEQEDDFTLETI